MSQEGINQCAADVTWAWMDDHARQLVHDDNIVIFIPDIKGDLSGLGSAGSPHPKIDERLAKIPLSEFNQRP